MSNKDTRSELRKLVDIAQQYGVTVTPLGHRKSGHHHYRLDYGKRSRKFISANSPSDHRARKNARTKFKHICRELVAAESSEEYNMKQDMKPETLLPELAAAVTTESPNDVFMPMIQHPLVHGFYLPENNTFYNRQLVQKQSDLGRAVSQQKWTRAVYLHERPYRLDALLRYALHMAPPQLSALVSDVWLDTEYPHVRLREWCRVWRTVTPLYAMSADEFDQWQYLPDNVTVYRGGTSAVGLSWTLSKDTAEFFAARFGQAGTVFTRTVKRGDIVAVLNGRSESECIIPKLATQDKS